MVSRLSKLLDHGPPLGFLLFGQLAEAFGAYISIVVSIIRAMEVKYTYDNMTI